MEPTKHAVSTNYIETNIHILVNSCSCPDYVSPDKIRLTTVQELLLQLISSYKHVPIHNKYRESKRHLENVLTPCSIKSINI